MSAIDVYSILQSFTEMYKDINKMSTDMSGMEVHWMRAIPHENSEDVIFQEYTLHDVECPKIVKVVTTNTSYNPGNYSIDYFGINYEAPLEICIDVKTWEEVYGQGIMPQQHDIVYVDSMNCLYEVASSTTEFSFANQETGFKIQMTKWNPRANVRLNQDVEDTINDLTVSEQELFGEEISRNIADIVDDEEISQMLNTSVKSHDIYKSCDLNAVNIGDISVGDNTVARSYYDLRYMKESIIYNNGDSISLDSKKPHRYFSCWFKVMSEESTLNVGSLTLEGGHYYLTNNVEGLVEGGEVLIKRGAFLQIHAVTNKVVTLGGQTRYMLTFNGSEYKTATKKVTNWNNNLSLVIGDTHPLLLGRTEGECNFNISVLSPSTILIKNGNKTAKININNLVVDEWYGIGVNLGKESNVVIFGKNDDGKYSMSEYEIGDLSNDYNIGEFYIPQSLTKEANIRFYQTSEKVDTKTIEKDLSSQLTKNNSDGIILDNAAVPNRSPYIAQQR